MFNRFGLSTSFRILAAVQVVIIVCGMTFCPVKDNEVLSQETKKKYFDWSICKNRALIVFIVALGFNMLGYLVPFVHLVSLIRGLELDKLLSVLFIVNRYSKKSISDWPIFPCNSSYPAGVDHIRMIVTDFKTIDVNCIDTDSKRDVKV